MATQFSAWLMEYGQPFPNLACCLLISIICGLSIYLMYFKESFSWEKYGVVHANTGVKTLVDFRNGFKGLMDEYGDTVGFVGMGKRLITTNLDLIKNVMVKDFSNFVNRNENIVSNSVIVKSVFFSLNKVWKRKRRILSPNFRIMNEKARRLATCVAQYAKDNRHVSVKTLFGQFTAEIIAQAAFGCQVDCFGNGDGDKFSDKCQRIFKSRSKLQRVFLAFMFKYRWCQIFLIKILRWSYFDTVNHNVTDYFISILKDVIAARLQAMKEGKAVPEDLLQMLLNASDLTDDAKPEGDIEDKLSMEDILAESILIIFASFETTSSALQFILYYLAVHPEFQDKVYNEIQETVRGNNPTYDEISQLTYTRQVIDEALRLQPPVPLTERTAIRDITYGNITIPSQARVVIPMFLVHRDPKLYTNPDDFDPNHFSSEEQSKRHPLAFFPFGFGPRQCLGIRMAYIEMKYALVHVLRSVEVLVNEHTMPPAGQSFKLKVQPLTATIEPIMLAVKPREMNVTEE